MQATQVKMEGQEEIPFMNIDETDFGALTLGQRIRHLEVEGYVVMPDVLDPGSMQRIKEQMADAPMQTKDYSDAQTYFLEPHWHSHALAELIANPAVIEFLEVLMGPDIVFTRGFFSRTLAGSPPISLHTDGQPFGSFIFGYEGSSPRLLRVLYYLDDLTPDRAPFRLLPRSHPLLSRRGQSLRALQVASRRDHPVPPGWNGGDHAHQPVSRHPSQQIRIAANPRPVGIPSGLGGTDQADGGVGPGAGGRGAPGCQAFSAEPEYNWPRVGTGAQAQGNEDGRRRHRPLALGKLKRRVAAHAPHQIGVGPIVAAFVQLRQIFVDCLSPVRRTSVPSQR